MDRPGSGRRRLTPAVVAALTVLVLAGCDRGAGAGAGAGQTTGPASQQVSIVGTSSFRFAPMTVPVHVGTVRITLRDSGAYPHNLVIPGLGVTSPTVTGDPGDTQVSFEVRFPAPGRYPFHCQYHASAGMVGVFVVS